MIQKDAFYAIAQFVTQPWNWIVANSERVSNGTQKAGMWQPVVKAVFHEDDISQLILMDGRLFDTESYGEPYQHVC